MNCHNTYYLTTIDNNHYTTYGPYYYYRMQTKLISLFKTEPANRLSFGMTIKRAALVMEMIEEYQIETLFLETTKHQHAILTRNTLWTPPTQQPSLFTQTHTTHTQEPSKTDNGQQQEYTTSANTAENTSHATSPATTAERG